MRIKIVLESLNTEKVKLPLHYNYLIQSFIYNHIDKELAEFLHNKGFGYEKRKFKMFVFSRVFSNKFKIVDEKIIFDKEIYFFISSPINEFLAQFAQNLFKTCEFTFGENDLILKGIHILGIPEIKNKEKIKMISPLTIYSTLFKKDKKKTYYYSPFEREFEILIEENLRKKYQAFYKKTFNFNFKIRPINVNKNNEKIINYKGTIIKSWLGTYEVESEPEIIKFAFDTGLGSKNSQGFGMFEICI